MGDPARGIVFYTREELEAVWISKTCLTLTSNSAFMKLDSQRKDKKQWFLKLLKEDIRIIIFSVLLCLGIASLGMIMSLFGYFGLICATFRDQQVL